MELGEIHDELLKIAPDGSFHDSNGCQFCTPETQTGSVATEKANSNVEGAMTFTEEEMKAEVDKAVAAATAKFEEQLAAAKKAKKKADDDADDADKAMKKLQAQLDTTVLENEKVKAEYAELITLLEQAKADAEAAAEIAQRKDERLAKVREVASFPEDYLTANADRWAAMDDESFTALCADYAQVSEKTEPEVGSRLPVETAMRNEREPKTKKDPAYMTILRSKLSGVDFSTL
jgi:chromosome segregation ATPase